ncbi:hypothetical protein DXG03_003384, partial [Asterophora parasitica]
GAVPTNNGAHTYTLDDMRSKGEIIDTEWASDKASEVEGKAQVLDREEEGDRHAQRNASVGVKITIDTEIGYDDAPGYHAK